MTDQELIARLRKADEYEPLGHDGWEAADRIEELSIQVRFLDDLNSVTATEQAEAKLAKAVEALREINALDPELLVNGCSQDALRGLVNLMGSKARATLAELEGKE